MSWQQHEYDNTTNKTCSRRKIRARVRPCTSLLCRGSRDRQKRTACQRKLTVRVIFMDATHSSGGVISTEDVVAVPLLGGSAKKKENAKEVAHISSDDEESLASGRSERASARLGAASDGQRGGSSGSSGGRSAAREDGERGNKKGHNESCGGTPRAGTESRKAIDHPRERIARRHPQLHPNFRPFQTAPTWFGQEDEHLGGTCEFKVRWAASTRVLVRRFGGSLVKRPHARWTDCDKGELRDMLRRHARPKSADEWAD